MGTRDVVPARRAVADLYRLGMRLGNVDGRLCIDAPRELYPAIRAHKSAILAEVKAKNRWKVHFTNEYGAARLRVDDDYRRANSAVRPRIRRAVEKRRQWMIALFERGDLDTLREVVIDLEKDVYEAIAGGELDKSADDKTDATEFPYRQVLHSDLNPTTLVEQIRAKLAEANIKQAQFEVTDPTGSYVISGSGTTVGTESSKQSKYS